MRGARTVPREAVVSIVAMVEAWPGMLANMLDTVRAREVLELDHNFRVLDERIERLRRQVKQDQHGNFENPENMPAVLDTWGWLTTACASRRSSPSARRRRRRRV
jgi:hypothetical protein